MADRKSPGIDTSEVSVTSFIQGASNTIAGYVGAYTWGPIGTVELASDEGDMASIFGEPKAAFTSTVQEAVLMATSFMTASSNLAYSNGIRLSRVANTNDPVDANNAKNSVADLSTSGTPTSELVKNVDDFETKDDLGSFDDLFLVGKYAGLMGNSIKFSACFTIGQYKSNSIPNGAGDWVLNKNDNGNITLEAELIDLTILFSLNDYVEFTYDGITYKNLVTAVEATKLKLSVIGSSLPYFPSSATTGVVTSVKKVWQYTSLINGAPSSNEFHLVLSDATGLITGEVGAVLNVYPYLSNEVGKTNADGTSAYWRTVLNDSAPYVWAGNVDLSTALSSSSIKTVSKTLVGGSNGTIPTQDDYLQAIDLFKDKEAVDISLFVCPPLSGVLDDATVPNYLIQNLSEVRKDVVTYLSPRFSDVVRKPKQERDNIIAFRSQLPSSSYAFLDSGWKYMYDRYNNTYRWIPLCGDIAGTAARTDDELDSWWSHAGYNRGIVKNIIKLAWSPDETNRDDLYPLGINPVIQTRDNGVILFGDKTLLARPDAFDRINVRRLFIVLEKAISDAAKFQLFEFNDEITRSRFVSIVEPFLRDVKGRRGITDFRVICDITNNTNQVVDTNRFVASVLVRANKSINFIKLNFYSVDGNISFETVAGQI